MAEPAAFLVFGQERLHRGEPGIEPMPDPAQHLLLPELQLVEQVMPDARHDQRVRVGNVDQRKAARPGACRCILRQQWRLGVFLVEIFEDRQRLKQLHIAIDQGRHDHLRVERLVLRPELVALLQMQKGIVMRQPLQVQRDPHPETRLRSVIGIKLHGSISLRFSAALILLATQIATGTENSVDFCRRVVVQLGDGMRVAVQGEGNRMMA